MPATPTAIQLLKQARMLHAPSKAAIAGRVAVSGFEMSQNSLRIACPRAEVDARLRNIIKSIHEQCVGFGAQRNGYVDYFKGANIAGFIKAANAMLAYGVM